MATSRGSHSKFVWTLVVARRYVKNSCLNVRDTRDVGQSEERRHTTLPTGLNQAFKDNVIVDHVSNFFLGCQSSIGWSGGRLTIWQREQINAGRGVFPFRFKLRFEFRLSCHYAVLASK